ncbi:MAG: non-canonical purine NTP pyrophosphatase, partial [Planctomycetota bacterium]
EANNRLLLEKLEGVPAEERTARFRCVIALASPEAVILMTEGAVEGVITTWPRGDYGFGYDPVFVPEGHEMTFGELGAEIKDAISHRARALAEFEERFRAHLLSDGP